MTIKNVLLGSIVAAIGLSNSVSIALENDSYAKLGQDMAVGLKMIGLDTAIAFGFKGDDVTLSITDLTKLQAFIDGNDGTYFDDSFNVKIDDLDGQHDLRMTYVEFADTLHDAGLPLLINADMAMFVAGYNQAVRGGVRIVNLKKQFVELGHAMKVKLAATADAIDHGLRQIRRRAGIGGTDEGVTYNAI